MIFTRAHRKYAAWNFVVCTLTLLLLSGCQTTGKTTSLLATPTLVQDQGLVSIFIQLAEENGSEAWLKTSAVELVGDQGTALLAGGDRELNAAKIGSGQRFLARGPVEAGNYTTLRLHLESAALLRGKQKLRLVLDSPIVDLPLQGNFQLKPGESRTLIMTWDDQKSLANQSQFKPEITVHAPKFPLLANLAYVSCPDIDTLYLLSTDRNHISGSFAVQGKPSYMAYSPTRKRLYILSEEQGSITVVETATNRIVDQFKIPMTMSPSFFMTPDGTWGYILDEKRGNLIRMDLNRGSMDKKVHLGYQPRYLAWHEAGQRLLLTSALDQKVYFLDPETLKVQDTLLVGSNPDGLWVNDAYLYVAEQGSNTISIFDSNTLQPLKKLSVGFSPRRLIGKDNNLYVSNFQNNSVSLILARQQRVARSIQVGKGPLEMDLSNHRKWLYITAQDDGTISVLDQTSNKLVTTIELGAKPADILSVY
jgi:YVTN family beta-propeller protein